MDLTQPSQSLPLVTIIIAVRNAAAMVGRTLQSAIAQRYPRKEIIVVDGASTDGTQDEVAKFSNAITTFISEPDKGVADAYNKGIRASHGEWVYFLNADDVFDTETTLAEIFGRRSFDGYELVLGRVRAEDGRILSGRFAWTLLLRNNVHHQALFYRGRLIRERNYNVQYRRYGHDHEHNLSLWKSGARVAYVPEVVAEWRLGGISDAATWRDYKEEFRVRRNVVGRAAWLWNGSTVVRYALKQVRKRFRGRVGG